MKTAPLRNNLDSLPAKKKKDDLWVNQLNSLN